MATSVPAPSAPISRTRHARRAWLFAGGILTPVAVLLSTVTLWSFANELAAETETQHRTYTQPVRRVVLNLHDGDITLAPGEAGQVVIERRLEWSESKPTIEETWAGDALQISSRCGASSLGLQRHCAVAYVMRVPPDVAIDARTVASKIDVRDLGGDLRLSESSGDVNVTNTTGRLWVQTTSGGITGAGLRCGQVDVQATSGDIDLGFAAAPQRLTAKTGSGNVDIAMPDDDDTYRVVVETSAGDTEIKVRQDPVAARTIGVQTSRGDVHIRYAS